MRVKTAPAVVRVSARDRRIVTFTLDNPLDEPVSGSLQFDLPVGLAVEPKRAFVCTDPAEVWTDPPEGFSNSRPNRGEQ
jgi:hypothetical protein